MSELQTRGRTNKIGEFMSRPVAANDPDRIAKLQAQEAMEEAKTQERQQRAAERAAKRAGAQQVRKKSLHAYVCFIASCS